MPNFERLHELCSKLAALTAPDQREPGLSTWCIFVGETWQEIARMWEEDPKRAAAPELYEALDLCRQWLLVVPALYDGLPMELAHKITDALAKARGEQNDATQNVPEPEPPRYSTCGNCWQYPDWSTGAGYRCKCEKCGRFVGILNVFTPDRGESPDAK